MAKESKKFATFKDIELGKRFKLPAEFDQFGLGSRVFYRKIEPIWMKGIDGSMRVNTVVVDADRGNRFFHFCDNKKVIQEVVDAKTTTR